MDNLDFRNLQPLIITLGSHPGIIQSMLDYYYCLGHDEPNIKAIISAGRKQERYFWGHKEIVIPVHPNFQSLPHDIKDTANYLLNVQSARRVLEGMKEAFESLPALKIANIFAEQVPEIHALKVAELAKQHQVLVVGPSSVGILVPGVAKLGAIGGTQYPQMVAAGIFAAGDTAVISTSGGMVNELIHITSASGRGVSFALALGGDRYPATTAEDAFLLAEADSSTRQIVYFGELGGEDEYLVIQLIKEGKITKPIVAYVAGTVAELFDEPPQFGHAKAMASNHTETAAAKKEAMREAGINVLDVFVDLKEALSDGSKLGDQSHRPINRRRKSLIVSRISGDINGDVHLLGKDLLETVEQNSLAGLDISLLLGHQVESQKLIDFTDYILKLLVDHGPYVSGALNTIITARAGRDLVSGLVAGLLTVGPRFGGAINGAADAWLNGIKNDLRPKEFVNNYKANNGIIPGIGHKKYRIDVPDPRVKKLVEAFGGNSNGDRYLKFAKGVEEVTTGKKGNLILNVDGTIAAAMLDILESELQYTHEQLEELVDIEFFNAIFVLGRTAGFMAHYLDQRRHDEGLLRLGEDDITYIP